MPGTGSVSDAGMYFDAGPRPTGRGKPKFFEFRLFMVFCGAFGKIAKTQPLRGRLRVDLPGDSEFRHRVLFEGFVWFLKNSVQDRRGAYDVSECDKVRGF